MPITTATDTGGQFAVVTLTDPHTIDEWRHAMLGLWTSPGFRETRAVLVDRRLSAPPTTAFVDAMIDFFALHREKLAGTRSAILVGNDAGFGMGRMTELKASRENPNATIRPFRLYDDAVLWLTTRPARVRRGQPAPSPRDEDLRQW